jgi:hypothetical protein
MNNENLEFLQDCLKYLGFGDKLFLNQELAEYIIQGLNTFQLETEAIFGDEKKLEATLYFRRSEQLEMYFFNKYEARLRSGTDPNIYRVQTFYIHKGTGVTLKEAFNLLEGRAVNRNMTNLEGQKYNAWIQLNFAEKDQCNNYKMTQFRPQYGYDLEKTLEKYPIREMADDELRASLLRSLRKGNQHFVTFDKRAKTERMAIEANPALRTINIYPARSNQPARQNDSDK